MKKVNPNVELASSIASAFNEGKVGVFETDAGVDKSLAYLVPAAMWSIENKQKVVVSAATIERQQQLIEEDIPRTSKAIGKEIKASLVGGGPTFAAAALRLV